MFKLTKIMNSGTNVPEPIKLVKNNDLDILAGVPISIVDDYVVCSSENIKPQYISLADSPYEDFTVVCYEINPHMLFETELIGNPKNVHVGQKLRLRAQNDDCALDVTDNTDGKYVYLFEKLEATENGAKIIVKFIV